MTKEPVRPAQLVPTADWGLGQYVKSIEAEKEALISKVSNVRAQLVESRMFSSQSNDHASLQAKLDYVAKNPNAPPFTQIAVFKGVWDPAKGFSKDEMCATVIMASKKAKHRYHWRLELCLEDEDEDGFYVTVCHLSGSNPTQLTWPPVKDDLEITIVDPTKPSSPGGQSVAQEHV